MPPPSMKRRAYRSCVSRVLSPPSYSITLQILRAVRFSKASHRSGQYPLAPRLEVRDFSPCAFQWRSSYLSVRTSAPGHRAGPGENSRVNLGAYSSEEGRYIVDSLAGM